MASSAGSAAHHTSSDSLTSVLVHCAYGFFVRCVGQKPRQVRSVPNARGFYHKSEVPRSFGRSSAYAHRRRIASVSVRGAPGPTMAHSLGERSTLATHGEPTAVPID